MNEKILRIMVPLIPTLLILACLAVAFATHDWDVKATVLGEQSLQALEIFSPEGIAGSEAGFEVTGYTISEDRTKLMLNVIFHSPLKLPVRIKELQADLLIGGSSVVVHLPSEVIVPPRGSASLTLEGPLPPNTYPPAEQPTLRSMRMTLDVGGITITLEQSGAGGVR